MDLIRLLLSSSWKILILAGIVSLVSGVTTTSLIAFINQTGLNYSTLNASVIWTFFGLCFLRFISNFLSQSILIYISQEAILNLRMLISQRLLASPLYQLEKLGNNRIMATLTDDVQSISNTALILPRVCVNSVIVISCLLYLCWLSPTVFLIILFFLVIGITSHQLTGNKASSNMTLAREQQDKLFKNFRGITDGTKELMLHYKKRETFFKDLQANAESYKHENVVGMSIFALASSWAQIMFFVAIGIVIFILPALKNTQTQVLSGYVLTITYLIVPLDAIINSLSAFSKAFVALDKIKSLDLKLTTPAKEIGFEDNLKLLTPSPESGEENLKLLTPSPESGEENLLSFSDSELFCQRLELLDVTYKYQSEDKYLFTVGPINFTFSAGEIVFLIGGNGSGKSTFIKLLIGLYIPDTGKIIINGKLITAEEREWYRQHFSVVFFDFYLFENLLNLGKTISDEQISDYLVKLQLNNKVQVKNGVLSTTALSQGQRKRLALLTAYLEDRAIYVFDEWASDQDPIFKNIFYTQILPDLKSKGKLVIVVTHDDQYYHLSDRIIKLNNGIVEYDKLQQQPL
ncbi:ATP-binding cassette domain-containing protein [Plectonema radiosum NIES-515]|uniref:ATP-binding cassette domain-containing protein n=1 Tax=Plectonema radiosum NIES-515 TaxID=2986073 RepID=A0ABT3ATS5_9CYAN|nr:ATP-binding cassette domain-containing protein [Plectonema radiosum]MCV3211989.1 ATP-binding cassette domain-containing protein [Plectonema radiosum NIES-515]